MVKLALAIREADKAAIEYGTANIRAAEDARISLNNLLRRNYEAEGFYRREEFKATDERRRQADLAGQRIIARRYGTTDPGELSGVAGAMQQYPGRGETPSAIDSESTQRLQNLSRNFFTTLNQTLTSAVSSGNFENVCRALVSSLQASLINSLLNMGFQALANRFPGLSSYLPVAGSFHNGGVVPGRSGRESLALVQLSLIHI